MSDVSNSDLKSLLEQQALRDDRRREADIEWRARFEGVVKTLADEVSAVRRRQDGMESRQNKFDRELSAAATKSVDALDAAASLEGRVIAAVGGLSGRLDSQDKEIGHVRRETDKQTPILAAVESYMIGNKATLSFLKWAVPLTGTAAVALITSLWFLFSALHH